MDSLVEERERGGTFASLEEFASRVDPSLLNRRQLESLAGAGAFDLLEPDRAAVFSGAEIILAHAASAHDQRHSGQAALFGGPADALAPIRLKRDAPWSLAQRMAAEREAFGFYFSAHPVEAQRHLLVAHQVRRYAGLSELRIGEGERASAAMAALVEDVRWRTSARGRRYMMATMSDPSGQFVATAFEDDVCAALEAAAKSGQCGLLGVELDKRPGDELPRVTVKRFQPLGELAKKSRLQLTLKLEDSSLAPAIAAELNLRRDGNGLVRLTVSRSDGNGDVTIVAGRDFTLDEELAQKLARLVGEENVELTVQAPPRLALVG
jgi:DNA polymerase-3 subunit alpha